MSEEKVHCTFCGQDFVIDKERAGASAPCPACGKDTFLDMPTDEDSLASYNIKDSAGVTEDKKDCPRCGAPVQEEDQICIHCGFNWETGEKKSTKLVKPPAFSQPVTVILLMVITAMAVYILEEKKFKGKLEQMRAETDLKQVSAPVASAASVEVIEEVPGLPEDTSVEEAAEQAVEGGAVEPVLSEEQIAELRARRHQRIVEEVDRQYPLFEKNENVTMRGKDGRIYRGEILGIKGDVVVLIYEKSSVEVSLERLDRESRMRCDKVYRKKYIQHRVQQYMQ